MQGMIKDVWMLVFGFGSADDDDARVLMQDLLFPDDDQVQRKVNAARARKTWNWLKHQKTPDELLIACFVLRPCLSFMGFLFRSESSSASHSVTTLLVRGNPAIKTVKFLLSMLNDLENDFWFLYKCQSGWIPFKTQFAWNSVFRFTVRETCNAKPRCDPSCRGVENTSTTTKHTDNNITNNIINNYNDNTPSNSILQVVFSESSKCEYANEQLRSFNVPLTMLSCFRGRVVATCDGVVRFRLLANVDWIVVVAHLLPLPILSLGSLDGC